MTMARNVKWRMRFMAFDNVTQYTVSIYTEDTVSSLTELTPAAIPFETQEDNDNNAFIPVRTSTGYLRFVVTDLSIINEIMCTKVDGRYVFKSFCNFVICYGVKVADCKILKLLLEGTDTETVGNRSVYFNGLL